MFQSRKIALILLLLGSLLAGCAAPAAPTATPAPTVTPAPTIEPSDSERKLTVDGTERSYLLHIPPGVDDIQPVPVLLAFGGDGDAAGMALETGFNDIADQSGFLAVYPQGTGSWNAGGGCCDYAGQNNVDDVAFVREILSDLGTIMHVDAQRVYAVGGSRAAGLAYRLACEMSDTFAAIAAVAGAQFFNPCEPQQPVSLIHVHGRVDTIFPFDGGGEFNGPPIEQVVGTWAKLDGCNTSPQVEKPDDLITHTAYSSCKGGASVELYTLEKAGHIWPSQYIWPASQTIWDFFAAHPKP